MLWCPGRISFGKYFFILLIGIYGIYGSLTPSTKCTQGVATENISDVSYERSVDVSKVNSSDINYTITFSWKNSQDSTLGILIKFEDSEQKSSANDDNLGIWSLSIPFLHYESRQQYCSKVEGKRLSITLAGKHDECTIPCNDLLTNSTADDLCCLLQENYEVYSKETTSLRKRVEFGRAYRLHLVRYSNDTIRSEEIQTRQLFCRDELISRHNFTLNEANKICSERQNISASILQTGPPSNVVLCNKTANSLTNRGEITYRFQKPYDISEKTIAAKFVVSVESNNTRRRKDIYEEEEVGRFYYYRDNDIMLGVPVNITIQPRFQCASGNKIFCTGLGQSYSEIIFIPDINACNQSDTITQYCDQLARCQDHPSTHSTPASCQCPQGYSGNGVSLNVTGGEGCNKISHCQNNLCHHLAACWDGVNGTNSTQCSCPNLYYGDGYKNGSGCSPIALPLGISFGILICIICTSLVTIKCLRTRSRRLKYMELFYSKYLDDGEYGDQSLQNGVISGFLGKDREIRSNNIEFHEIIGRGSFGVVRKATLTTESEIKLVAVKCIPDAVDTDGKESFMAEIAQMSTVGSHPNVITMIGLCSNAECSLGIVVEHMKYGDLQSFLWDAREIENRQLDSIYNLTQTDICEIAIQCANGLKYLKEIKIIHGDVAARNVLVTENLRCKLSDFGLSTDVYCIGRIIKAKERKLPLKWVSPERMMEGASCISWRSDIWSFGILLYEIVTFGAQPYHDIPNHQVFNMLEQGKRMERPESCSEELYCLMVQCWQWDPMKRPSPQLLINEIKKCQKGCTREFEAKSH